jgi:hypothetical protein
MRICTSYITTLLAAGAAAVAIAAAPMATAAPTPAAPTTPMPQSCSATGAGTECQSPGNVEIQDAPPPVSFSPYGGYGPDLGIV